MSLQKLRIEGSGLPPSTRVMVDGAPVHVSGLTLRINYSELPMVTLNLPMLIEIVDEIAAVVDPPPDVLAAYETLRRYRTRDGDGRLPVAARFIGGNCGGCRFWKPIGIGVDPAVVRECSRWLEPPSPVTRFHSPPEFGCVEWEAKP